MATATRWNAVRLEKKLTDALAAAGDLRDEYEEVARTVADETSARIAASGRGGSHNAEFANIEHQVRRSAAGRWNILIGWLNPPPSAAERGSGGKLWYQYQDSGFRLFGGPQWISGVGATIDQRYRLLDALTEVNVRKVRQVRNILNR